MSLPEARARSEGDPLTLKTLGKNTTYVKNVIKPQIETPRIVFYMVIIGFYIAFIVYLWFLWFLLFFIWL